MYDDERQQMQRDAYEDWLAESNTLIAESICLDCRQKKELDDQYGLCGECLFRLEEDMARNGIL